MYQYKGLLIRTNRRDVGMVPSAGSPTYSPDIICYQQGILTPKDAASTYDKYICKSFLQDSINNIYIRVKNYSDNTLAGKVKAYYAPLNMLYMPPRWTAMYSNGQTEVELVDMSYSTLTDKSAYQGIPKGEVGCSKSAFNLISVPDPNMHHCMMGLITSPDGSYIDLPESFPDGDNGLWKFLSNNPQIAYNNIVIEQPYSHTIMKNVEIGNLDASTRKYVMNVSIDAGVETLKNSKLILQSTNQDCPFSYQMIIDGVTTEYTFPGTNLPDSYCGIMNFALILDNYEAANAIIHVENFAVNKNSDEMEPDANIAYASRTRELETGTMLGDFYIYLGNYRNGFQDAPKKTVRTATAMRTLLIHD